jgi:hypothetical protein
MGLTTLFPQWRGLRFIRASPEGDRLTLVALANVATTQISMDPYTNSTSQHATEVAPSPS